MNLFSYYQTPVITPPIEADDPTSGEPSDHSVPVCYPHTDRFIRPPRNYKVINYRPLPQTSISKFGQWITQETWSEVREKDSSSAQALTLENLLSEKVNTFFPIKSFKLSSYDKPFVTKELKKIDRMRSREFKKHGKSLKYNNLKKQFEKCYKKAASKYLQKSLDALADSKPGKAFRILKSLGPHPEDSTDNCHFVLPSHEDLPPETCAEKIANHFSEISQEFRPLSRAELPQSVSDMKYVTEYEV